MNNRRDFENQPAPPTLASPTVPTPPVQQTAWSEQDPYGGSYTPYDQPQQGMYSEQQPQPQYYDQPAQQYYAQQAARADRGGRADCDVADGWRVDDARQLHG